MGSGQIEGMGSCRIEGMSGGRIEGISSGRNDYRSWSFSLASATALNIKKSSGVVILTLSAPQSTIERGRP